MWIVLDRHKKHLRLCGEKSAMKLFMEKRACIFCHYPQVLILTDAEKDDSSRQLNCRGFLPKYPEKYCEKTYPNIILILAFITFMAACICVFVYTNNNRFLTTEQSALTDITHDCLNVPAGEHDFSHYVKTYMENRYNLDFNIVNSTTQNDIGGLQYTLQANGDKYGKTAHVSLIAVRNGYAVTDDYMPTYVAMKQKNTLTKLCERYFDDMNASVLVQAEPDKDAVPGDALSQKTVCWVTLQGNGISDMQFAAFVRDADNVFASFNKETSLRFITNNKKVMYRIKNGEITVVKTLSGTV